MVAVEQVIDAGARPLARRQQVLAELSHMQRISNIDDVTCRPDKLSHADAD